MRRRRVKGYKKTSLDEELEYITDNFTWCVPPNLCNPCDDCVCRVVHNIYHKLLESQFHVDEFYDHDQNVEDLIEYPDD